MINPVNYALIPSADLNTFAKRIVAISEAKLNSEMVLEPFLSQLKAAQADFAQVFLRSTSDPFTPLLEKADEERDNAFLALRYYLESCTYQTKEGWSEAAEKLMSIVRKHGYSVHRKRFKVESTALNALVSEMEAHSTELTTLLAKELVDTLKAKQDAFENLVKERSMTASDENATTKKLRPDLITAIRNLFSITNLHAQTSANNNYMSLANSLNELITETMSVARAARTRSSSTSEPSPVEPQ